MKAKLANGHEVDLLSWSIVVPVAKVAALLADIKLPPGQVNMLAQELCVVQYVDPALVSNCSHALHHHEETMRNILQG